MANIKYGPADLGFTPSSVTVLELNDAPAATYDAGGAPAAPVIDGNGAVTFYAPHGTYRLVLKRADTTDVRTVTVTLQDPAPSLVGGGGRKPSEYKSVLLTAPSSIFSTVGQEVFFPDMTDWVKEPGAVPLDVDITQGYAIYLGSDHTYTLQVNINVAPQVPAEVDRSLRCFGLGANLVDYRDMTFAAGGGEAYFRFTMFDYIVEESADQGFSLGFRTNDVPGGVYCSGNLMIVETS